MKAGNNYVFIFHTDSGRDRDRSRSPFRSVSFGNMSSPTSSSAIRSRRKISHPPPPRGNSPSRSESESPRTPPRRLPTRNEWSPHTLSPRCQTQPKLQRIKSIPNSLETPPAYSRSPNSGASANRASANRASANRASANRASANRGRRRGVPAYFYGSRRIDFDQSP